MQVRGYLDSAMWLDVSPLADDEEPPRPRATSTTSPATTSPAHPTPSSISASATASASASASTTASTWVNFSHVTRSVRVRT